MPLTPQDLSFHGGSSKELEEVGAMWTMDAPAATRHRLSAPRGTEWPLVGQLSPTHPVTLTEAEKAAIHIPAAASKFVFSYPVVAGSTLKPSLAAPSASLVSSFLSVGGFMYLDAANRPTHATTLIPTDKAEGGLQFSPPRRWEAEWTTALMRQGRFQRITIKPLNDLGAQHFCWLRPGEAIAGCATQPLVPHGGFAYLFHEAPLGGSADEVSLDRYFSVASGDEYIADGEAAAADEQHVATFAVVSSLSALNELRDRVDAAPQAAESEALRSQIGRLQAELEQSRRCVACLDASKDTLLEPCGHLCMCATCAAQVRRCPLCRATVRSRRKAYTS